MQLVRNSQGITLPFALVLTFIFSALVGVAYLFVSVNLTQMQSSLWSGQAIAVAEGINERIKARLNTKSKIQVSPGQEEKLKTSEEEGDELLEGEADEGDEDLLAEEEFNEETEDFDEYYADEILKISRYITFREPPESVQPTEGGESAPQGKDISSRPEANVEMIGSIDVPPGTVLNKGIMIVVYKDEKLNLKLKDIVPEAQEFKAKLPAPKIKALTPNYSETNKRNSFVVNGENLPNNPPRFSNKDIYVEDVKAGPTVEILIDRDVKPGLAHFYWDTAQAEFYVIPTYDGSNRPVINDVRNNDGNQLLEIKAGASRLVTMIYGLDLYLKKSPPVIVSDIVGIIPQVKEQTPNGREITLTLSVGRNVESGVHSLAVATEGGLSNFWLFNVLPPEKEEEDLSNNLATYTSSLTLLDIRVIENLLPLIDEGEPVTGAKESKKAKQSKPEKKPKEKTDDEDISGEEPSETEKLSPFANVDLETSWLLETSCMVGKITKTVSEVVHRKIPNIHAAIVTNGSITFDGGGYQIAGKTIAMTTLTEPTYISNIVLNVEGPSEKTQGVQEPAGTQAGKPAEPIPQSPIELGFMPGSFVAVYKEGDKFSDLDYGVIRNVGTNNIELVPPGLMDFHYKGDQAVQFIPPIISREKISYDEAEKHVIPKDLTITIPNAAMARDILGANLEQFTELADLYTNDAAVPKDDFNLSLGYMGLTYVDGTPSYDPDNVFGGKGVLIIDTRADNQGKPVGDVEISGDSREPVEFTGLVYVHGNLKIEGNVTINGALVVDNTSKGQIQIGSNAIGRISFDERAITQTILSTPFTTLPGTIMISNKPINLGDYVQSGTQAPVKVGASSTVPAGGGEVGTKPLETVKVPELPPEEAILEQAEKRPEVETIQVSPGTKSAEEELIDLF